MFPSLETRLRTQLLDRRKKLQKAVTEVARKDKLTGLLREVDLALKKMDEGTYGLCETCHETIEEERILADPFSRNCLDHLTDEERKTLERDLDLAYEIQSALLPKRNLRVDGWSIAHHYEPAGPVSGDYCDLILAPNEPGSVYFLLGDVSGKGVAASILMAHLHAMVRTLALSNLSVGPLVERANRVFSEGTLSNHFATLVCGKATAMGHVELCNAGHCPPLHLHKGGVHRLVPTGVPIGLFSYSEFEVVKFDVQKGDSILLYSDGLTESRNPSDQEYGEERLISLVSSKSTLSPTDLMADCLKSLSDFRAGSPVSDDLTIMVLNRG